MSKFYIYAGGRWCEVETRHGRVEGFRERARFCYVRGGRLHAARSAAVLRALRALAAGAPGAARDAAPLPQRRSRSRRRSLRPRPSTHTHHCCAHAHSGCHGIATQLAPPVTPLSPVLSAPPRPPDAERNRRTSSEKPLVSTESPTKTKSPLKRSKVETGNTARSGDDKELPKRATRHKASPKAVVVVDSSTSEEWRREDRVKFSRSFPTGQKARVVDYSSDYEDRPRDAIGTRSMRASSKNVGPDKPHNRVTRRSMATVGVQRSAAEALVVGGDASTKKPVESGEDDPRTRGQAETVEESRALMRALLESGSESSGSSRAAAAAAAAAAAGERCKELLIGEDDVLALRRYLARAGAGRAALCRFDADERYKVRVFHRLNPLVTLERYRPLENLLRHRVTLAEFARNLGLRSVADVTPEKRYRMRRGARRASVSGGSETDKENFVAPKKRKLWNNENALLGVRSSRSSEPRREAPAPRAGARDASDSDAEFKRRVREQLQKASTLKRRDGLAGGARRRTRSAGKPSRPEANEPRADVDTRGSAKTEDGQPVRVTRLSRRIPAAPSALGAGAGADGMKLKLARVARSVQESEWQVVPGAGASAAAAPARALREQNNSGTEFEPSKRSPKKPNLIRKGKSVGDGPLKSKGKTDEHSGQKPKPSDAKAKVVRSMTTKPVKFKKSCVAGGREYSALEDHAIVAWVSGGGRERRVNGNRLWRELAADYQRLTGQSRSWHSLRNRYLRYVLPALPALALPLAQVSRLRAAAAAGEIKSKGRFRRNSIFAAAAVRSASARAPLPLPRPQPAAPAPAAPTAPAARRTRSAGGAASPRALPPRT